MGLFKNLHKAAESFAFLDAGETAKNTKRIADALEGKVPEPRKPNRKSRKADDAAFRAEHVPGSKEYKAAHPEGR